MHLVQNSFYVENNLKNTKQNVAQTIFTSSDFGDIIISNLGTLNLTE